VGVVVTAVVVAIFIAILVKCILKKKKATKEHHLD
jgi:uncharacterized membrane protein YgaE (UPF0421/DUF939 family)